MKAAEGVSWAGAEGGPSFLGAGDWASWQGLHVRKRADDRISARAAMANISIHISIHACTQSSTRTLGGGLGNSGEPTAWGRQAGDRESSEHVWAGTAAARSTACMRDTLTRGGWRVALHHRLALVLIRVRQVGADARGSQVGVDVGVATGRSVAVGEPKELAWGSMGG